MYAIELPKELLGRLARLRARTGRPIAQQVRKAVCDYLERAEYQVGSGEMPGEEETQDGISQYPPSPG